MLGSPFDCSFVYLPQMESNFFTIGKIVINYYSYFQKINPDVKIILSSGYEIAEIKGRNDFETSFFFLQKPYTIKDLASTLSKALISHQYELHQNYLVN